MATPSPLHDLLAAAFDKVSKATTLYLHSARKVMPFDPERPYSADELEPYDALVTRFERTIEVFLKFFRTVELFETAESGSTVRDCLGLMAKLGIIEDVEQWMEMREVRNRIAHDYVPDRIKGIYDLLTTAYQPEITRALVAADTYRAASGTR
ncbi:MAG: nucleotidyltransferase substrate binding protein [Planctomycetia bacterium]